MSAFRSLAKGFNLGATKKQRVKSYLGRHAYAQFSFERGRRINDIPYEPGRAPIAVLPTVKTAVLNGHYDLTRKTLAINIDDLRMWQLRSKVSMTIVLVIDASSSTRHFLQVLAQAIAIIYRDAYRKKDKLGLIVVKDNEARILIQPTRNYQLVLGKLVKIEASGLTPLASGLEKAFFTLKEARRREKEMLPCVVLVSDCFPEPLTHKYEDLFQEPAYQVVLQAAKIYEREKIPVVVINPYHGMVKGKLKSGTKLGMMIAQITKGKYFGIPENEVDEMTRRGYIKKQAQSIAGFFDELRLDRLQALPESSQRYQSGGYK
jgi:magnesium chelatase subunit D